LNNEASAINTLTGQMKILLDKRNAGAEEYNKIAEEYNKKYNGGLEFNQAEYTGKEINVYQFGNKKDLILAITHELGHALGMGHVDNPKSIMYYITGINAETNPAPTAEDLAELNKVCR
jgi:predicted Zn-dependent protease